jgi:hypothetical protein
MDLTSFSNASVTVSVRYRTAKPKNMLKSRKKTESRVQSTD